MRSGKPCLVEVTALSSGAVSSEDFSNPRAACATVLSPRSSCTKFLILVALYVGFSYLQGVRQCRRRREFQNVAKHEELLTYLLTYFSFFTDTDRHYASADSSSSNPESREHCGATRRRVRGRIMVARIIVAFFFFSPSEIGLSEDLLATTTTTTTITNNNNNNNK